MLCYGKRSITHENTTKIDQHFPRSISSIDFTCEIIHVRAEGAVLGSTDGRRSGRAVEAARDVCGGRHVEDIFESTGKSAAQRRVDGLHRRELLEVAAKSSRGDRTALVDGTDKSKTRPSVDPHKS